MTRKPLLKYRIDWISIALVVGVVVISLWPIFTRLHWLAWLAIAVLLMIVKPITSLVQHNHVHYPIFNARWLNTGFNWLLSVSTGHIASEWVLHHNIGHHGNAINSLADTSSVRHPQTREYMSKWQYIVTGSLKIYPDCFRMAWDFYHQGKKRYLINMCLETQILLSVYAVLFAINATMTFWFLLVPNLINRALVWLGAYWHHLEVPANSAYDSSNMYTGPFFNWISLNIGYHIAHHEKPSLHWSHLKEHTQKISDKIPEQQILARIP